MTASVFDNETWSFESEANLKIQSEIIFIYTRTRLACIDVHVLFGIRARFPAAEADSNNVPIVWVFFFWKGFDQIFEFNFIFCLALLVGLAQWMGLAQRVVKPGFKTLDEHQRISHI